MRLLLAEDEVALSRVLGTILEKNDYSVEAVYDGISALEHLETEIYDGAILDIMMPGTDGITVLKKIRKKGNRMPVIRTMAIDFWATLEHELKYKKKIPCEELIRKELKRCADEISATDISMQTIRDMLENGFCEG
ncbi:MAG: response regulator [Lachnospiraceae bacterium]|nr:response regulator [Lachnospiraceae bacterium]